MNRKTTKKTGYLAATEVNRGRQPEMDCLKAICIIPMVILHAYETCGNELSGFYHAVHLLEALTGAAAFMFCMGLGTGFSRHRSPKELAVRGAGLLTGAQILYFLRDALPSLILWWIKGEKPFIAGALLIFETDIMTFAGLAFLLMALFRKLKARGLTVFLTGLGMNAGAFLLAKSFRGTGHYLLDQLIGWFVLTDTEAYFPVCCYFIFPAAGFWLGEYYPRIRDKDGLSAAVLKICAPAAAVYYALRLSVPFPGLPAFMTTEQYILNPGPDALANITMSLALLALFHRLLSRRGGRAPGFVTHLSTHINQYYCFTYVLLSPMGRVLYALRGEMMPGPWLPLLYGVFVLALSGFLIEWMGKHPRLRGGSLSGRKRILGGILVWALTALIIVYAYPKTDVYANVWTDYLLR